MRAVAMLLTLTALAPATGAGATAGRTSGPRRTVAVASFALPPDFLADPEAAGLGAGLAAIFTTALVESQRFVVVERPALDAVAPGAGSALVVPELQGPRAGLPAHQLLLVGTVTEFTQAARESGFTLGVGLGPARIGLSPQTVTGRVALDIRAVDPATGQVVAAYGVRESFKARGVAASLERGALSLGRSGTARTPVGEAARRAVHAAVGRLSEALADREWSGRVVDVEEREVSLNAGASAGIRIGDRFLLYRTTRVLTDPETGQVLGARRRVLGRLHVTSVEPNVAFGRMEDASTPPQRGDSAVFLSE